MCSHAAALIGHVASDNPAPSILPRCLLDQSSAPVRAVPPPHPAQPPALFLSLTPLAPLPAPGSPHTALPKRSVPLGKAPDLRSPLPRSARALNYAPEHPVTCSFHPQLRQLTPALVCCLPACTRRVTAACSPRQLGLSRRAHGEA